MVKASTEAELDTAFADFRQQRVGALLVNPDPFLLSHADRIAALALASSRGDHFSRS